MEPLIMFIINMCDDIMEMSNYLSCMHCLDNVTELLTLGNIV